MIYRDDLERVYKLLERPEAWCKGVYTQREGDSLRHCLSGAYMHSCEGRDLFAFAASLGLAGAACVWNDAPERTHAEVLELLRRAIERAPVREV